MPTQMSKNSNTTRLITQYPVYPFEDDIRVPIVQTGNIFATGGDTTGQNSSSGNDGFTSLVPTLQFSGTAKIDISLSLPTSLAVTNACQINLIFRGFLSLGASNLNK